MKEIVIREDLNCIVKSIGFKKIKNNFGERTICNVTFFNDKVIEFKDSEHVYELFQSFRESGETDFIKSKELVEEYRKNDDGEVTGKYICVKFILNNEDNTIIRLFTSKYNDNLIIENYYNAYKKQHKTEAPKK